MGKLKPEERWNSYIQERFEAFKISGELRRLRTVGLKALGRKKLLTAFEYKNIHVRDKKYLNWAQQCEEVSKRFGLAPWTIKMASLLENYDPKNFLFPIGIQWPSIHVITTKKNDNFLKHLSYIASSFGIYVYLEDKQTRYIAILTGGEPPQFALKKSDKPKRDEAFTLEVRFPPDYPPEAAQNLSREACVLGREILRRLGYKAPQRLRTSKLLAKAKILKLDKFPVNSVDTYNIIDKMWKDENTDKEQQRRKLINRRRYKLKKRLIEPYK